MSCDSKLNLSGLACVLIDALEANSRVLGACTCLIQTSKNSYFTHLNWAILNGHWVQFSIIPLSRISLYYGRMRSVYLVEVIKLECHLWVYSYTTTCEIPTLFTVITSAAHTLILCTNTNYRMKNTNMIIPFVRIHKTQIIYKLFWYNVELGCLKFVIKRRSPYFILFHEKLMIFE